MDFWVSCWFRVEPKEEGVLSKETTMEASVF